MSSEQQAAIESLLQQLSKQQFDLAAGPLLRAALIRVSEHDQLIVLTIHHIICGGLHDGLRI
jgi:hypothetical protein